MINNKPIEILLVEDNPADIRLTQEAFKETRIPNHLHIARDGVEALAFLRQTGKYMHVPRPDIILLDLNLPKKDGRELLDDIKNDPDYRQIPVVILTTSTTEEDIIHTYDHHANCYITKPSELESFLNVVKSIENFWLTVVKLPICET
jgi:CheY-like chemotaxis protein